MAEQISAWRADDGSIHAERCDAVKRNIVALVGSSELSENTPYMGKVMAFLTGHAERIAPLLAEYIDACPNNPKDEAPSESLEGTREERTLPDRFEGHTPSCRARATAFLWDCNCGFIAEEEPE